METKIVSSSNVTAKKGFRAEDYIKEDTVLDDISDRVWSGINQVASLCFQDSKKHGWWDKYINTAGELRSTAIDFLPEIIGSKLMLKTTEIAEAYEEIRNPEFAINEVYYSFKDKNGSVVRGSYDHVLHVIQSFELDKKPKPEGVPIELADVIIRIFDFCAFFGIDIAEAVKTKMTYNETRPYKHGGKTV